MNKLYVEYRLEFNSKANQDSLHELAERFQEHIYDMWNNDAYTDSVSLDVTDVTYEVIMEIRKESD